MNTRKLLLAGLLPLILLSFGCCNRSTFNSRRVVDETCFRGSPATVYKTHLATITWSKLGDDGLPLVTRHICKLPVLFSVDVKSAPLGTTEAKFEYQEDGQLKTSYANVDQQIDEFITSVSDAIGNVTQAAGVRGDASEIKFQPDLPDESEVGPMMDIQFQEM